MKLVHFWLVLLIVSSTGIGLCAAEGAPIILTITTAVVIGISLVYLLFHIDVEVSYADALDVLAKSTEMLREAREGELRAKALLSKAQELLNEGRPQ